MELDLNSEPLDPLHDSMLGLGSLLNELETAHGRIEERIRQLEAVTSRSRQRQRWRQGQITPQIGNISTEPNFSNAQGEVSGLSWEVGIDSQERIVENGKMGKRDSTHLIAKALAMDTSTKRARSDGGGFFDCNICLDLARDPILTCCGHLFCWACFYRLSYAYSNVKECPACNGEVKDTSIIPIYGDGSHNNTCKSTSKEYCSQVPPRPQACRIESVRQQLINRGAFSSPIIPIEVRIQQFGHMIGAMGERTRSQDFDGAHITGERNNVLASRSAFTQVLPPTGAEGNQHNHPLRVSRLLLQGAASFSSLSSALNSAMDSAERLVENVEAYINSHHSGRSHRESSPIDRDSFSSIAAVVQHESQSLDITVEIDSAVPSSASSLRTDVLANDIHLVNEATDTAMEVSSTMPPSSSSRRRIVARRVSHFDSEVSREHRRRRLR